MLKKSHLSLSVLLISLVFALHSCKNETENPEPVKKDSVVQKNISLEGYWISTQDTLSRLIINSDNWTESYKGEKPEEFKFAIGDTCLGSLPVKPNTTGKYVTVFDPDGKRCFYIVYISDSKMDLSYVGRGNTLTYKKKK